MRIERVLVSANGNFYYVRNLNEDFHTKEGFIKKEDLAKNKVISNLGVNFFSFAPAFVDLYRKIKRLPQIIPLKDLGYIAAEVGLGKESIVVDAGAGSGAASIFFANIAKEVFSYEVRLDFMEVVQKNIESVKINNLTVKNKSIYDGIDEKGVDFVMLDLPEPWNAIIAANEALKSGGFLASYSPTMPQVQDVVDKINSVESMMVVKVAEISEREWEVNQRKVRPFSQAIGHSGFLVIARKVGE